MNHCPFLVIPSEGEGSAVRHSFAPPLRATTFAYHHRIRMETPTAPLSFRVPGKVSRTRRSLAFARDDKKERVVARKGRLLDETVVAVQGHFSNLIWTGLAELRPGLASWDKFSRP
jgi:hypothetical protein